jgi:hypothetical protein
MGASTMRLAPSSPLADLDDFIDPAAPGRDAKAPRHSRDIAV